MKIINFQITIEYEFDRNINVVFVVHLMGFGI